MLRCDLLLSGKSVLIKFHRTPHVAATFNRLENLMRVPTNSFAAADLELCRAHGDAVHDHNPMPPFTTAELANFKARFSYRDAIDAFEQGVHTPVDLPLPPSHDADLAKWRSCLSGNSKSEQAAWEWWAVSVCPSGDAEDVHAQWLKSSNFDDWFAENLGSSSVMKRRNTPATGDAYVIAKRPEPAEKRATHIVCIKAHISTSGNMLPVGKLLCGQPRMMQQPDNWLSCDKDGWVSHERGSACSVRCLHEVKLANGEVGLNGSWSPDATDDRRIVAWRPTGGAA